MANDSASAFGRDNEVLCFLGEKMTRREVEIARYAFGDGARWAGYGRGETPALLAAMRNKYPLPLVMRPRVVQDPHEGVAGMLWMYDGRRIVHRRPWVGGPLAGSLKHTEWSESPVTPTPERVRLWADLIARPTEQIEEGE
jgi:hypothetical protein